jgi:hypothetical protein
MCIAPKPNPIPLSKLSNNSTEKNLFGTACAIQGSVAKCYSTHFLLPPLLELQLHLCSPTCITSVPWTLKMPSRSPCPKAAEAKGRRPGAGRLRACGSRGHFGGRCCPTAAAKTDHSQDARPDHNITCKSNSRWRPCDHFLFARSGWFTLIEPQKPDHTKIFRKCTGCRSNRKKRFKITF